MITEHGMPYHGWILSTGFAALWGTSIVHCAFCHGVEFSDGAGALLGLPDLTKLLSFTAITKNLTLLTNGEPVPKVGLKANISKPQAGCLEMSNMVQ